MDKGVSEAINVLSGWVNGLFGIGSSIINFVINTILLPLNFLSALLS